MEATHLLEAIALQKTYGDLEVLKKVSLTIPAGQFVSIVGPSGAGKSTLLHLLAGLDKPTSGHVLIEGKDINKLSAKQQAMLRNKNMGFIFQFHHLLPEFTAIENVAMPLWISGISRQKGLAQAEEYLGFVGLAPHKEKKPAQLSGGEQQRVAIARALATKPAILFADEPTGNLDTDNALAIHQLLLDTQKEYSPSIIMVTHNEKLAGQTDRSIFMKDGKVVSDTPFLK